MKAATSSPHPVGKIPKEIKLSLLDCFESKHDSETIKKILAPLEIFFILLGLKMMVLGHYFPRCI